MAIKRIFKQDQHLGLRALLLLALSIALILLDHHSRPFHRLRQFSEVAVAPFEYAVTLPIDVVEALVTEVSFKQHLIETNNQLQAQVILLQAQVQQMRALENENAQLKALLQSSAKAGGTVVEAEILAASPEPFTDEIFINQGANSRVYVGQPVVDASGVLGQVIEVNALSSRVLLLTDPRSEIPVENARTSYRAIALGRTNLSQLTLQGVSKTEDVEVGDLMITSGLGGRYPFGYPVARVVSVHRSAGDQFSQVILKPTASIHRGRVVLLVWPQ